MALNFEKLPARIGRGLSFIIYGDPGVGKTTLAATLPVGETLIVSVESGVGPLLGTQHTIFNVLTASQKRKLEDVVNELYAYLRTQEHPFKYVVLDNLSELEQQLLLSLCNEHNKDVPELSEYGDTSFKMREWVHQFRDLTERGITVVFNAWEFPLEIKNVDGVVVTKTFPLIGKKIAPSLCGIVDVVGHLEVHEASGRRWVRFGPSGQYITKSQFKGLSNPGEEADFKVILPKLFEYNYGG